MERFEACPCRPAPEGLLFHHRHSCAGTHTPASRHTIIQVLQPPAAQRLVGQVVHGLEDRQSRHQAGGQRRMAGRVRIGRAAALLQEPPVNHPPEPGKCVVHVDDLVEPGPEKIALPAVPPLLRTHQETPSLPRREQGITIAPENTARSCKQQYFIRQDRHHNSRGWEFFTGDYRTQ